MSQRQALPISSAVPQADDRPAPGSKATAAAQSAADFSAEFARTRSSRATDSDSFYSTDRHLSLKGQAAMETYVTNAGFQFGRSQSEWVGVDLYA